MSSVIELLGQRADYLLNHKSKTILKENLHIPSANYIDTILMKSNRNSQVLRNFQNLLDHGRLAGTGYCNILPVDQGVEHSAGSAFSVNPIYFDPENIAKLGIEGGCNALVSTFGSLAIISRQYAHKIPLIVKVNHNEFLSYPNRYDQTLFGTVKNAWNMGAIGVGATIYWGSEQSNRQLKEIAEIFEYAHELGMITILWCYTRNDAFKVGEIDYTNSADFTAQANHLGVTLQADIIKQKMPLNNGGYLATKHGKTSSLVYEKLTSEHPIDLCRYQVLNCYSGRIGLINSGGESKGGNQDLAEAAYTAVINKRAGGMGLILGRKAFQRTFKEGVELLNLVQDIYKDPGITIA